MRCSPLTKLWVGEGRAAMAARSCSAWAIASAACLVAAAAPVAAAAEQDFSKWAAQVDPASGNTYYYHTETRATSWVWPPEKAMA